MRAAIRAVLVLGVVWSSVASATLVTLNTADHPNPSNLSLELFLGDPEAGGLSLATIGPIGLSGSTNTNMNYDLSDSGTLQFLGSAINLSNFSQNNLVIGAFGTADVNVAGVGMNLTSGSIPVANNNFSINSGTSGSLLLNSGTVVLSDTTGLLGTFLPSGTTIDLGASPINVAFSSLGSSVLNGTTDDDGGLNVSGAEVNLALNGSAAIGELAPGLSLYAKITGGLNVGSTAVIPEIGSMLMVGLGSLTLVGVGLLRRRS